MESDHVRAGLAFVGPSGSGKTFQAERFSARWRDCLWRFVFDHTGQWQRKLERPAATTLPECDRQLADHGSCLFDPGPLYGGEIRRAFAAFCHYALVCAERLPRVKLLIVEEVQDVVPAGSGDLKGWPGRLFACGRHQRLDFMVCSQFPNKIHDAIRGQLTAIAAFRVDDALPLAWLEERGFNRAAIRALPKYGYYWKEVGQPPRLIAP
jgi:hypothetical protein